MKPIHRQEDVSHVRASHPENAEDQTSRQTMNNRKKEGIKNTVTALALIAATIYIGFYFLVSAR